MHTSAGCLVCEGGGAGVVGRRQMTGGMSAEHRGGAVRIFRVPPPATIAISISLMQHIAA